MFQKATVGIIHGHHHVEDEVIFPTLAKQSQVFSDAESVFAGFDSDHKKLVQSLEAAQKLVDNPSDGDEYVKVWTDLQNALVPHLDAEEQYFTDEKLDQIPQSLKDDILARIQEHNKADPMGWLTLPLMLWTLTDENYDRMIRPAMPKFVRAVLCNYIFYYKGASDLLPFVPHYRDSWTI